MTMQDNLKRLYDKALELGATRASMFSARDVVVDERVRFKCPVPRCPSCGTPMLMSVDDFRRILARYEHALLVQMPMGLSGKALREKYGEGLTFSQLMQSPGYIEDVTASIPAFSNLVSRLEAEAFNLGYRFAAGLGGRSDNLAAFEGGKAPNGAMPPIAARPTMEAMGIDVFETARRAGLPIAFPAEEIGPYHNGLILVE